MFTPERPPERPPAPDPLRAAGLRRTPARLRVLAQVEALERPHSHAELLALPELRGMDDITLYRTLAVLEEVRLVHRIYGLDGVWRYGAKPKGQAGCPGNHAHFLCTVCGAMRCLADQPIQRVEAPEGALVVGRQLLAFGRCAGCEAGPSTRQEGP